MTAAELPSIEVPRLRPTDRLVGLPPRYLVRSGDGTPPALRTAVRVGTRDGDLLVRFAPLAVISEHLDAVAGIGQGRRTITDRLESETPSNAD